MIMNANSTNVEDTVAELLVESPSFSFNCAHFIAYKGFRETLHGHNYNVSLKVRGRIQEDGYVVDFSLLKNVVKKVCSELDHHFILPIHSDVLKIENVNSNIQITCEDNSVYSFPQRDCAQIPVRHSSTEEIAQYILNKVIEEMDMSFLKKRSVSYIEISVNESPTQKATVYKNV
ncbi:6-pyruvoyltetrahydropterin synthase, putative [Plasmodium ovale wallikeri]|uniref:6-pyruvoyltetrahydropterin synthase n=2 Tax=Plasmodium ovale TaxID=36330 RepID=A0A1A8Z1C9_PLAOA|nr:6-pyruvoyltetrahydropterin synthase, putative [Plasmodium ovale wallikeri]SBT38390.1 6-pyruvoyltetrahydropterin synthase, putative [Plasmodium ovale wallikeri]SBT77646.1 6-pyruvoyltetrahydropterin synthase, putative [Plasmodium ovale]